MDEAARAKLAAEILTWPWWAQVCTHARVVIIPALGMDGESNYGKKVAYDCPVCGLVEFKWPPLK
jgi:hypothetical protein